MEIRMKINNMAFPDPWEDRIHGRDLFYLNEVNLGGHSWCRLRTVREYLMSTKWHRRGQVWRAIQFVRPRESWLRKQVDHPSGRVALYQLFGRHYNNPRRIVSVEEREAEIDIDNTLLCELGLNTVYVWVYRHCEWRTGQQDIVPFPSWRIPREQNPLEYVEQRAKLKVAESCSRLWRAANKRRRLAALLRRTKQRSAQLIQFWWRWWNPVYIEAEDEHDHEDRD